MGDNWYGSGSCGRVKNPLTISLAFSYAFSHAGPKSGTAGSSTGGGLFGQVSGKTPEIELSEGTGKGSNEYEVMVGLRTFPSLEKPLATRGGPRDVDEGSIGGEENLDDREEEEETTLLVGGLTEEDETTLLVGGLMSEEDETTLLVGGLMTEEDETTLLAGELMTEEDGVERVRASTVPRRINREERAEKGDARSMFREGR
jgi:hypothetical protein